MGLALNEYFLVSMFVITMIIIVLMNIAKHYIEIQEKELIEKYKVTHEAKDTEKSREEKQD